MTLVFLSVVIGMEAIYIPLAVASLALGVLYLSDPETFNFGKAFFMGLAFGLVYSTRPPELLLFPVFLAVVIFFALKESFKRKASLVMALFVGFFLIISVQQSFNHQRLRTPLCILVGNI